MTRRVAAIDLGSNTVRLLVADVDPAGAWTEVARDRRITRLGEGLHATGAVTPAAIRRTADALRGIRGEGPASRRGRDGRRGDVGRPRGG